MSLSSSTDIFWCNYFFFPRGYWSKIDFLKQIYLQRCWGEKMRVICDQDSTQAKVTVFTSLNWSWVSLPSNLQSIKSSPTPIPRLHFALSLLITLIKEKYFKSSKSYYARNNNLKKLSSSRIKNMKGRSQNRNFLM